MTLEGNPWFVGADTARVLGIRNITDTLKSSYIDTAERARFDLEAYAGNIVNIISESSLYKLVMRSDKPEAKRFQDWVTKEVLPSIRKTGGLPSSTQAAHGEHHKDDRGRIIRRDRPDVCKGKVGHQRGNCGQPTRDFMGRLLWIDTRSRVSRVASLSSIGACCKGIAHTQLQRPPHHLP